MDQLGVKEDDEFPQYLCEKCTTTLTEFHKFKSDYKNNEEYLKNIKDNEAHLRTLIKSNVIFEKDNDILKISENNSLIPIKNEMNEDDGGADSTMENWDGNGDTMDTKPIVVRDLFNENFSKDIHLKRLLQTEVNDNTAYVKQETEKYSCEECGDEFSMQTGFVKHMRQKHRQPGIDFKKCSSQIGVKPVVNVDCKKTPSRLENFCKKCKICFANAASYLEHKDKHNIHPCDICGKRFPKKSYLADHRDVHSTEKKFKCPYCPNTYRSRTNLVNHKRVHTNPPREYKCDTCGKPFKDKSTMLTHVKLLHLKTRDFMCPICGLTFPLKQTLERHIKGHKPEKHEIKKIKVKRVVDSINVDCEIAHSGVSVNMENFCKKCNISFADAANYLEHKEKHKIHACDICGKRFPKKSYLADHRDIHSTERKFKCPYCPNTYKTRTNLVNHKKTHTDPPREYICDTCGKVFTAKSTLLTHVKLLHLKTRDFMCPICGLTFQMKQILERHIKRHGPGKHEYFCLECKKGYKNKFSLTRHNLENHNSEKVSFACDCGKEYKSQSKLSRHKRAQHGIDLHGKDEIELPN